MRTGDAPKASASIADGVSISPRRRAMARWVSDHGIAVRRAFLRAPLAMLLVACGPKVVEVRTTAQETVAVIEAVNTLQLAVNLYAVSGDGIEHFVRQIPAGTTLNAPVRG